MSLEPSPPQSREGKSDDADLAGDPRKVNPLPQSGRRRGLRRWIFLGLILGYLGGWYYFSHAPKVYTATSTLLILPQAGNSLNRENVQDSDLRTLNTMVERIRRFDLLETVSSRRDVRDVPGLIPPPVDWKPGLLRAKAGGEIPPASVSTPTRTVLAGMMTGWLDVAIRPDTWLIDISIKHPVPEVARQLANAVSREYLAELNQLFSERRTRSRDMALETYSQISEIAEKLVAKESERAAIPNASAPANPEVVAAEAELKVLKERFLSEFAVVRFAPVEMPYWEIAGREMPDQITNPEAYLRIARQLVKARIDRKPEDRFDIEFQGFLVEMSEFARLPDSPSAPDLRSVLVSSTLSGLAGGLLLALVFGRPYRR